VRLGADENRSLRIQGYFGIFWMVTGGLALVSAPVTHEPIGTKIGLVIFGAFLFVLGSLRVHAWRHPNG
jgi:hypothetical protein